MIITCNNCSKNFSINSNLIPEKGRLLQCNGCNHKWFFTKEIIKKPTTIDKIIEEPVAIKEELELAKIKDLKTIDLLDNQVSDDFTTEKIEINKDNFINNENKKQNLDSKVKFSRIKRNYNILGLIIIFIISFIALIIVLDTFQGPIGKIVPNLEFLLYNLYETINDIELFFRDLI